MALKELLALADKKLAEVFHQKAPDPSKARKGVLKSIDTTASQFASATPTRGRKRFAINNGVVEYKPGFAIDGEETFYVPSERFSDFLTKLKANVESGELDTALVAGESSTSGSKRTGKRGPLSPEALASRRAKIEARKASKGQGAPA